VCYEPEHQENQTKTCKGGRKKEKSIKTTYDLFERFQQSRGKHRAHRTSPSSHILGEKRMQFKYPRKAKCNSFSTGIHSSTYLLLNLLSLKQAYLVPEQLFWWNVVCAEVSTKVRCVSPSAHPKTCS
jgi:hypothetical protein